MAIELRTEIPGPKSRELMARRHEYVARGPFHGTPVFVESAHGAVVVDADGNRLLDFGSGIAVNNLGHTPPAVVEAITAQAQALIHSSFNIVPYEGYIRLAERLADITPGKFAKKTFLANSGAEAVENAIKIARAHTRRQGVIAFDHGFHGRTYMAMTLTSKLTYRQGFGPYAPEVYRTPFPHAYRCPGPDASAYAMRALEELVLHHLGPHHVAAVIIEPVLGEGGYIEAPVPFMRGLREFCTKHGIVLVIDEVQTGFGRTGTMFACEHYDIEPDLMCLAKGLGSGLPISAVIGRAEIMDAPAIGAIGGTYGGNPVACAAALAVIDALTADGKAIVGRARALGETLRGRLLAWQERFSKIGDVRGLGTMLGMEIVADRATRTPDPMATSQIVRHCYERGLIVLTAGTYGNVIRLAMPLVISDQELEEGLAILESGLASFAAS